MIAEKYFDLLYQISPLYIAMDLSDVSLEQALIQHKFNLEGGAKYSLIVGRDNISEIVSVTSGLKIFNIFIEIQEELRDEWYLVNEDTKLIVYSPGA